MTGTLVFDPLLPWLALYVALGLAALGIAIALWRGLTGWWLAARHGLGLLQLLRPAELCPAAL